MLLQDRAYHCAARHTSLGSGAVPVSARIFFSTRCSCVYTLRKRGFCCAWTYKKPTLGVWCLGRRRAVGYQQPQDFAGTGWRWNDVDLANPPRLDLHEAPAAAQRSAGNRNTGWARQRRSPLFVSSTAQKSGTDQVAGRSVSTVGRRQEANANRGRPRATPTGQTHGNSNQKNTGAPVHPSESGGTRTATRPQVRVRRPAVSPKHRTALTHTHLLPNLPKIPIRRG